MGDTKRFDAYAKYLSKNFPKQCTVADVAGGKGYLQTALRGIGFENVVTFDKRKGRKDRPKMRYQYRYFGSEVKENFDLLVGLHPDEATDVIITEAWKRKIAFSIVPCCVMPKTRTYWGAHNYSDWIKHLRTMAEGYGFRVSEAMLPISGRNIIITGRPKTV